VTERLDRLLEAGVPVAGLWLQDWTGICNTSLAERIWWNWRQDKELYPDWPGFAEVREKGPAGISIGSSNRIK
jgi:alpha-glucosidase